MQRAAANAERFEELQSMASRLLGSTALRLCARCGAVRCAPLSAVGARAQLTLARLPPTLHLFWLCLFAFLGVLIASTVRVSTDAGTGIVTGAAVPCSAASLCGSRRRRCSWRRPKDPSA